MVLQEVTRIVCAQIFAEKRLQQTLFPTKILVFHIQNQVNKNQPTQKNRSIFLTSKANKKEYTRC